MEPPVRLERSRSQSSSFPYTPEPLSLDEDHELGPARGATRQFNGDDDEGALLFDALSALNILKRGGSSQGAVAGPAAAHLAIDPHHSSASNGAEGSRNRPHDPSRSASTASTQSDPWDRSDPTSSTGASSPVGSTSLAAQSELGDAADDPNFIARVSQLPLVSGGLDLYQRSKASSRVVKYGAGLVESSLSAVSRPLANNLQLNQLDDFACRQLDRFGGPGSSPSGSRAQSQPNGETSGEGERRSRDRGDSDASMNGRRSESPAGGAVAVASRSRWQTVLMEAGGLGAAVSEESLKSLRYCLQWLLYATAHLDHQIGTLRDFIASLHRHGAGDSRSTALVTASATAHLTQIKHDVVETIRKVVDVVSKYAGAALPEQAKRYVRQSILGLPMKWASAIETRDVTRSASVASGAGTPTPDRMDDSQTYFAQPMASTSTDTEADPHRDDLAVRSTEDAAERVLTFAVESLDMLRSVSQIFTESVEKAEAWIERLRIVGLDRQRQQREARDAPPPPEDHPTAGTKRRRPGAIEAHISSTTFDGGQGTDIEDAVVRRRKGPRSRETTTPLA